MTAKEFDEWIVLPENGDASYRYAGRHRHLSGLAYTSEGPGNQPISCDQALAWR